MLPTRFPNLLVNGPRASPSAWPPTCPPTTWPRSINACVAYIDDPEIDIPGLMKYIPAPDFPTGGTIYGYNGVKEAYETGRGRVLIRAKPK